MIFQVGQAVALKVPRLSLALSGRADEVDKEFVIFLVLGQEHCVCRGMAFSVEVSVKQSACPGLLNWAVNGAKRLRVMNCRQCVASVRSSWSGV